MSLKRVGLASVLVFLVVMCASMAIAQQSPMDRVKEGSDKLIKILSDPALQDPAKHDAVVAELRATAEVYIDFRLVTMYAVGKPWLDMSEQMQSDLVEAFIQLLERSYLQKIPAYGGQQVKYDKELISGKKAKVITEIIDKDKTIGVEFRLQTVQGQWMIYDVVAEGVSLVSNYRSQFSPVLSSGTADDLLKLIRDRIKKLDSGEQVDTPKTS